MAFPQSIGGAEGGQAGFCGNAGTGEDDEAGGTGGFAGMIHVPLQRGQGIAPRRIRLTPATAAGTYDASLPAPLPAKAFFRLALK